MKGEVFVIEKRAWNNDGGMGRLEAYYCFSKKENAKQRIQELIDASKVLSPYGLKTIYGRDNEYVVIERSIYSIHSTIMQDIEDCED